MTWDKRTHRAVTLARLKLSAPEVVYQALEDYGENACTGRFSWETDEGLELALEARGDPLINLGLARNASSDELLRRLYTRAREGSGDLQYDQAIRRACLGNRVASAMLFSSRPAGLIDDELRRLAVEGDREEIRVLMQNPSAGGVLRDAYSRKGPFDGIADDRWLWLAEASARNPRLNIDDSDVHGPDMLAWDIHKAILGMLQGAPATKDWLRALYYLLIGLDKDSVSVPGVGEVAQILHRWAGVRVPKMLGTDEREDEEGLYTEFSFAAEFRCLVAALYGRTLKEKSFEIQGRPDHEDLASRCAYYGNAQLTPDQVLKGFERDGNAFCFAALFNNGVLLDRKSRTTLEPLLRGELLLRLYGERCAQLANKWRWFDPKPVSEDLEEALDHSRGGVEDQSGRDSELLAKLAREVAGVKLQLDRGVARQIKGLIMVTTWGLIAIGVLILFRH